MKHLLTLAVVSASALPAMAPAAPLAAPLPLCRGDYADDLSTLSHRVRAFDRDPKNQYSYCLRTTAVFECLSYSSDGTVRRARRTTTAHGSGFAFRRAAGESYVLTNDHVASWPTVTDDEHPVEGVPLGCKRISQGVRIVDNEDDGYEGNDIPLTTVVSDPLADVAVLKTAIAINVIPYRHGRSGALRVGNVVAVHGYPLGVFAATNFGKVVNALDNDTEQEWDHADFVTDALLSQGGSGSPVLALSCRTGEYELVGIYHAGYERGSALNVVVGIDQLRDLMSSFTMTSRAVDAAEKHLGTAERSLLREATSAPTAPLFFPLGSLVASVRGLPGGALWFEVYSRTFPLTDERLMMVEQLPADGDSFGDVAGLFIGNHRGIHSVDRRSIDADAQAQLARVLARLQGEAVETARYRKIDRLSKQGEIRRKSFAKARERQSASCRDAAQLLGELSERLGPRSEDRTITASDAMAAPARRTPASLSRIAD